MKSKQSKIFTVFGIIFICAAAVLTAYNVYEANRARMFSESVMSQIKSEVLHDESASAAEDSGIQPPVYVLNPDMEMPVKSIDGRDYIGYVEIPSLELALPVLNELTDSGLRVSPCRYKGSLYKDDLIIAAHNYTSYFGNIKDLHEGDEVVFTDMAGNVFRYEVASVESLLPTAVEEMESGIWDLTLFTCTYGGQFRITVRCDRVMN